MSPGTEVDQRGVGEGGDGGGASRLTRNTIDLFKSTSEPVNHPHAARQESEYERTVAVKVLEGAANALGWRQVIHEEGVFCSCTIAAADKIANTEEENGFIVTQFYNYPTLSAFLDARVRRTHLIGTIFRNIVETVEWVHSKSVFLRTLAASNVLTKLSQYIIKWASKALKKTILKQNDGKSGKVSGKRRPGQPRLTTSKFLSSAPRLYGSTLRYSLRT
ncbi:hypothetical protein BDQ17DRAFT_1415380 [Cyathus striatus]|nr:hypothetical protein BDQ17DRAFT_1415380 [Cyathus striatus]